MKKKRALGILAATFIAAALPMVAASPASADGADCEQYVSNAGYSVGPRVHAACDFGAGNDLNAWPGCYLSLVNIGVGANDAQTACNRAAY